ncbi:MAG: dihydrolipoamide acetyltransferase family protein [Vampirovibrionales bacterium]|nr:dihydrolipoamide acetyltransferase family protein [Vampirovibrionales bacterium]
MAEPIAFKLPDIGEGVAEGEIVAWHVEVGDVIQEDAPLLDVMTDKVTAEIPSPLTGRILERLVEVGQIAAVGQVLVRFEPIAAAGALASAEDTPRLQPAPLAITKQDDLQMSSELSPTELSGGHQADVKQSTPACEILTPQAPPLGQNIPALEGSTAPSACPSSEQPLASLPIPEKLATDVKAAPATRRLARSLGVQLETLTGSGPGGRITPEDVQLEVQKRQKTALLNTPNTEAHDLPLSKSAEHLPSIFVQEPALSSPTSLAPQPRAQSWPLDAPTELSPLRRRIASHLVKAKQQAPHFTLVEEMDMTNFSALRQQLSPVAKAEGWSLSYLPLMLKALTVLLPSFPEFNATFDEASQQLTCHRAFHAGIAVDIPEGLVVPVLKNAHCQPLRQLAESIADLANRARSNRLQAAELVGGSLTITNIGAIGGLFGTPILNLPQVAILGIGKIQPRAMIYQGEVVARQAAFISITCDHRIIDGALAARFLNALKTIVESPERLVLA